MPSTDLHHKESDRYNSYHFPLDKSLLEPLISIIQPCSRTRHSELTSRKHLGNHICTNDHQPDEYSLKPTAAEEYSVQEPNLTIEWQLQKRKKKTKQQTKTKPKKTTPH